MWSISDNKLIFESYQDKKASKSVYELVKEIKKLQKDISSYNSDIIYNKIAEIQEQLYCTCMFGSMISYPHMLITAYAPGGVYYDVIQMSDKICLYNNNSDIIEISYKQNKDIKSYYLFTTQQSYKNNIFNIALESISRLKSLHNISDVKNDIPYSIVKQSNTNNLQLKASDIVKYSNSADKNTYSDDILTDLDDLFESKNNIKSFKHFFNESFEIGLEEQIKIPELKMKIPAKIDSGNDAYNVLHGDNIQINGNQTTFTTVNGKQITKPLKDVITINVGAGNTEDRPVVCFDIILGNKRFKNVPFSIGYRADNDYPILVGKPFISKIGALINVRKKNTL